MITNVGAGVIATNCYNIISVYCLPTHLSKKLNGACNVVCVRVYACDLVGASAFAYVLSAEFVTL